MPDAVHNELHIWLADVDRFRDPAHQGRFAAWLDDDERERWKRFRFKKDRDLFLVAHALVRHTLSRYADVAPEAWRFARGEHGRPEIAAPTVGVPLRFNLSHTRGLAAVLINETIDCGVDVEPTHRDVDFHAVSRRVFSSTERDDMLSQPDQRTRFFEYWTLKESYIKARGMGLALPLDRFAFCIGTPITIGFVAPINDEPSAWQFELHRPTDRHQLALAARRADGENRILHLRTTDFE